MPAFEPRSCRLVRRTVGRQGVNPSNTAGDEARTASVAACRNPERHEEKTSRSWSINHDSSSFRGFMSRTRGPTPSHTSAGRCPKIGLRAKTSHPCSARLSSRNRPYRPKPEPFTRHRDGSMSEPKGTERRCDRFNNKSDKLKMASASVRPEEAGKEHLTRECHSTPERLRGTSGSS